MTDTTLADKIEALAKDATPGPWETDGRFVNGERSFVCSMDTDCPHTRLSNAALIVELVNNLPTILRALRERDQAVEALREIEG